MLLRLAFAIAGKPETARRTSAKELFSKDSFESVATTFQDYKRLFLSYRCYSYLERLQKQFYSDPNNRFGVLNYGNALRYGKLAVVYIANSKFQDDFNVSNVDIISQKVVDEVLNHWLEFEEYAKKQKRNHDYFRIIVDPTTDQETLEAEF